MKKSSNTQNNNFVQHEVVQKTPLLDKKGRLVQPGYATEMNFIYNRENIKAGPFKLKEWVFYQFVKEGWSLQMTIGHVSYCSSVSATLINLQSGEKYEFGTMKFLQSLDLDKDPEGASVNRYSQKDFDMCFEVTDTLRKLSCKGKSPKYGDVEVQLAVQNNLKNPKMVIATPFFKPKQFYLNYKENYYIANGFAKFGELVVNLDGCCGLVDWGRGVWPYSHQWFWGNLSANLDGKPFGFNIGWGFGDLSHASENIFFYDGKAYKLGHLQVSRDESDYTKPWHLADCDGKFEVDFVPTYDNYTQNKMVVVNTHCHQVYGLFSGFVQTDCGKVNFSNLLAFIEHAVNKW